MVQYLNIETGLNQVLFESEQANYCLEIFIDKI